MSSNGISHLANKKDRQTGKLDIAQAKRQGKIVAADGTISGSVDSSKAYYRSNNIYDLTSLPTTYGNTNTSALVDNPNVGGLLSARPWTGIVDVPAPVTIEEAVLASTLVVLESWYDASDGNYFTPSNPSDGATFTQWADKSAFAHNANPIGGATTRPTVQTNELNGLSVVRFDGTSDGLDINPYTSLVNAPAITIFVVSKLTNNSGYPKLFGQDQSLDMFYSTDSNSWRFNLPGGAQGTSTGANDSNWHIHTVAFDGTQSTNATKFKYRRDKTSITINFGIGVVGTVLGPGSTLNIGNYNETSQFFAGDIAEFLIFTKALTLNEIENVENYLSNKWGL